VRRASSAEAAAEFARLRNRPRHRRLRSPRVDSPVVVALRYVVNLAPHTLAEIQSCVEERIARVEAAGEEVPHITRIAQIMLQQATKLEVRQ
jgi:hypothetical protein